MQSIDRLSDSLFFSCTFLTLGIAIVRLSNWPTGQLVSRSVTEESPLIIDSVPDVVVNMSFIINAHDTHVKGKKKEKEETGYRAKWKKVFRTDRTPTD